MIAISFGMSEAFSEELNITEWDIPTSDSSSHDIVVGKDGITDMIMGVEGYDKPFLEWCGSFFEYKWNFGEQFARL